LLGIGLGVPGPVDPKRGVALRYPFIRDWQDVPIGTRIAEKFGRAVFIENNLRSMALAELWSGQGRGLRELVCLGIRSGIGSGIISDGKLLRGARNLAGEIGRWVYPLNLQTTESSGPAPQTIEETASLTALLAAAAAALEGGAESSLGKPGDTPNIAGLLAAVARGDQLATRLIREAAAVHAWILSQLALLLDPECIVIAGPLTENSVYLDALQDHAARLGGKELTSRVVRSSLGDRAGALGAAALAFHLWTPPHESRDSNVDATLTRVS
jgi:predicted NBD/HSP70 family sugar kinase